MKVQYLNAMVNEKLMLKNAESVGVTPTDDELNEYADKQIEQLKQAYPDDAQLQQVLEANGFTEDSYKDYAKKQYKLQKVLFKISRH